MNTYETDEDYILQNLEPNDSNNVDILDYAGENIVKIFPYRAVGGTSKKRFGAANAVTVVRLSQEEYTGLLSDEDGNQYTTMLETWTESTGSVKLGESTKMDYFLKNNISFNGVIQWYFQREPYKPDFFTIGEPADFKKINKREQFIYLMESIATEDGENDSRISEDLDILGTEVLSEISLTNAEALEEKYDHSKFFFTDNINWEDVKLNEHEAGLSIKVKNSALIGGIQGNGITTKKNIFDLRKNAVIKGGRVELPKTMLESLGFDEIGEIEISMEIVKEPSKGKEVIKNTFLPNDHDGTGTPPLGTGSEWVYYLTADKVIFKFSNLWENVLINLDNAGTTYTASCSVLNYIGPESDEKYGDIDLYSKEPWTPFKMTPILANPEKVEMYADWFDYDLVLPEFGADTYNKPDGATLKEYLGTTYPDDLKLIEDMLVVSYGYSSNWEKAPIVTEVDAKGNKSEIGKIKPDFRIGHSAIKVSLIVGKNPLDVIDGLFESHLRKHPAFKTIPERYLKVKSLICALSRYIYSSYAIGRGHNDFHNIYLPWYLEPFGTNEITFADTAQSVANPDKGSTGDVNTWVLKEDLKFKLKSVYFNNDYSKKIVKHGQTKVEIPQEINFSNTVLLQTDRKLTLPRVPAVIKEIEKLPLPGDINTKSAQDLSYIWYLPISDLDTFKLLMLNQPSHEIDVQTGDIVEVKLQPTLPGTLLTKDEIDRKVYEINNGIIQGDVMGSVTEVENFVSEVILKYKQVPGVSSDVATAISFIYNGVTKVSSIIPVSPDPALAAEMEKYEKDHLLPGDHVNFERLFGYSPNSAKLVWKSNHFSDGMIKFNLYLKHQEFKPINVMNSIESKLKISLDGRDMIFDMQNWEDFLSQFNILTRTYSTFNFKTRDNFNIKELQELSIHALWMEKVSVIINGREIEVENPNSFDETITEFKLLFY